MPATSEPQVGQLADVPVVRVTKTQRATEWLRQVLLDGPVEQKTVEAMAAKDGITAKPLKTAKGRLKVKSVRKGGSWRWQLPFADKLPGK